MLEKGQFYVINSPYLCHTTSQNLTKEEGVLGILMEEVKLARKNPNVWANLRSQRSCKLTTKLTRKGETLTRS